MAEWQDIASAPIQPFDADRWWASASPSVLVYTGNGAQIAWYGYTKTGKGRWQGYLGNVLPTHWQPLPEPPK